MAPTDLAVALEQRGFESLWVAEHSHMPVTRRFTHPLGEAALTKEYFDVMDPFVTLSAAAAVTKRLKLGTAICLVIQRDTIQTAKLVASLDQVSKGRFLFGIGCGWNAEEMEDHGTVYETRTLKMREQIEAMKQIWTKDTAEYHGQIVDFPPMQTRPKPVQEPHPPVIVGGAFRLAARRAIRYGDGILPAAPSAGSGSPEDFMPRFRKMAEEAGRDPTSLSVTQGSTGTFGVSLSTAPGSNVTVTVSRTSGNTGLSVSSGGTLTFTPANWSTAQNVTIAADIKEHAASEASAHEVLEFHARNEFHSGKLTEELGIT